MHNLATGQIRATCSTVIPVIWPLSFGQPSDMVILHVKVSPEVAKISGCGPTKRSLVAPFLAIFERGRFVADLSRHTRPMVSIPKTEAVNRLPEKLGVGGPSQKTNERPRSAVTATGKAGSSIATATSTFWRESPCQCAADQPAASRAPLRPSEQQSPVRSTLRAKRRRASPTREQVDALGLKRRSICRC